MRRRENLRPHGPLAFETGLTTHGGGVYGYVGYGPWLLTSPTITHPLEPERTLCRSPLQAENVRLPLQVIITVINPKATSYALSIGRPSKTPMISSCILPVPLSFHYRNREADNQDHQPPRFCIGRERDLQDLDDLCRDYHGNQVKGGVRGLGSSLPFSFFPGLAEPFTLLVFLPLSGGLVLGWVSGSLALPSFNPLKEVSRSSVALGAFPFQV